MATQLSPDEKRIQKAVNDSTYNVVDMVKNSPQLTNRSVKISGIEAYLKKHPTYIYIPAYRLVGDFNVINNFLANQAGNNPEYINRINAILGSGGAEYYSVNNLANNAALAAELAYYAQQQAAPAVKKVNKYVNPALATTAQRLAFLDALHDSKVPAKEAIRVSSIPRVVTTKAGVVKAPAEAKIFKNVADLMRQPISGINTKGEQTIKVYDITGMPFVKTLYTNKNGKTEEIGALTNAKSATITPSGSHNNHIFGYYSAGGESFVFPVSVRAVKNSNWQSHLAQFINLFVKSQAASQFQGLNFSTVIPTAEQFANNMHGAHMGAALLSGRGAGVSGAGAVPGNVGTPLGLRIQ